MVAAGGRRMVQRVGGPQTRWWLTSALIATVVVLGILAPVPVSAAGSATLTGRVYGSSPAHPIAGVTVTVHSARYGVPLGTATTAVDGSYAVTGLPQGAVRMHAEDPSGTWASRWNAGARTFLEAPDIVLSPGTSTTSNLSLLVRGSITGTVIDEAGLGLPGIEVTSYAARFGAPTATTTTDATGRFDLERLPPTPASLRLHDPTGERSDRWERAPWTGATPRTVSDGGTTDFGRVPFPRPGGLTGTVVDAVGRPVADATVVVAPEHASVLVAGVTTGPDGRFTVSGLFDGDHDVLAVPASYVADPVTGWWPRFLGDVALVDGTSRDRARTAEVRAGATVDVGPIHVTPRHCDPSTVAPGADLAGRDLAGADLSGCYAPFSDLASADLTAADLGGANLAVGSLVGADLAGAALADASLVAADLSAADLTGADLTGADLRHARTAGAIVAGVTWSATTCPDGVDSDDVGGTCIGHLGPSTDLVVDRTDDATDAVPGDGVCAAADGGCTVRAALQEADASAGVDRVVLAPGTYVLDLVGAAEDAGASGDLDVADDVTIDAAGATVVAAADDRVLDVHPGAEVAISGLSVAGGTAPWGSGTGADGEAGGGIRNDGALTLVDVAVVGNTSGLSGPGSFPDVVPAGGAGGGIANTGSLVLDGVTVALNTSGRGGNAPSSGGAGGGIANHGSIVIGPGGAYVAGNRTGAGSTTIGYGAGAPGAGRGGAGGGVFNAVDGTIGGATEALVIEGNATNDTRGWQTWSGHGGGLANDGVLTLVGVTVTGNATGNSNARPALDEPNGGRGGGMANTGTLILEDATIDGNRTGNGWEESTSIGTGTGDGGDGGGIANAGSLTVRRSTVVGNTAGSAGRWSVARGGDGGGIVSSGTLVLESTTVAGNRAGDGAAPPDAPASYFPSSGGDGGRGGDGGGIAVLGGTARLTNVTISGNVAGDGGDGGSGGNNTGGFLPGPGGDAGDGGDAGRGGGIAAVAGAVDLVAVTVTRNAAGLAGTEGYPGFGTSSGAHGTPGTPTTSSGLAGAGGTITVTASIVAAQAVGADCEGAVTSGGANVERTTSCGFAGPGDVGDVAPGLWPLGDHGGPTPTHQLGPSSPAVDRVPIGVGGCGTTLVVDQRGSPRPVHGACDAGAVER